VFILSFKLILSDRSQPVGQGLEV